MADTKLTPELVAKLHQNQRELHDILQTLDDTEYCGIDCQSYRAIWQEAYDKTNRMLEKFGPVSTAQRVS
jgi:hypothetical protein